MKEIVWKYFFSKAILLMNSLKCPRSKLLSHCPTELFPIYQNKHWTILQWDSRSLDPSSHYIILKIVGFFVSCLVWSGLVWLLLKTFSDSDRAASLLGSCPFLWLKNESRIRFKSQYHERSSGNTIWVQVFL